MRCTLILIFAIFVAGCSDTTTHEEPMDDSIRKALDDFQNRKIYTSLNIATLRTIPDDELELVIVDYVVHKLESNSDENTVLNSLTDGNRAFWLTWIVQGEVNNGGFNQYYWNTEGRHSSEAVSSFEFFSASKHAALMREANSIREQEAATIKEYENKNTVEAFSDSYKVSNLGPLDTRFYTISEDLSALRIAKIREAPELFTGK